MNFKLTFDKDKCKGCAICIQFCPKNILAFDTSSYNASGVHAVYVTKEEECVGCQNCVLMCPDAIIKIVKNN